MSHRRSAVLLTTPHSIQSLLPSTLTCQIDDLLNSHRIQDAVDLVDSHRRKLEANITIDPDEHEEIIYSWQCIGFQCFQETLFEDAGRYLFNGELDPRVLVSYFGDISEGLFVGKEEEEEVDVFSGVVERMPREKDVDELNINLVRNYSPHLKPNTKKAPTAVELRRVLNIAAREMLLTFLEKCRKRAKVERDTRLQVNQVVDTALAKLYAHFNRPLDLQSLLSDPSNAVILSHIESSLQSLNLHSSLANIYLQRGEETKLLDLYASVYEENAPTPTESDSGIDSPLDSIVLIVQGKKERDVRVKWGMWMLAKGEIERGLKLLIPSDIGSGKRRERESQKEEDLALLQQIEEISKEAGRRFLEYLVLTKRNMSPDLHTRLAIACIDDLLDCLQDETVYKLWRAKTSSYTSTKPSSVSPSTTTSQQHTFLSHFASTTPDSPSKRKRLKTIFMLSGSSIYDAYRVRSYFCDHLSSSSTATSPPPPSSFSPSSSSSIAASAATTNANEKLLALELSILDGKLKDHTKALRRLVHDLKDSISAEVYCTLGGEVVPVRNALAIVESTSSSSSSTSTTTTTGVINGNEGFGLSDWYYALFETSSSRNKRSNNGNGNVKTTLGVGEVALVQKGIAPAILRHKSVNEETKKELLGVLVGVYMSMPDMNESIKKTTHLLNTQPLNLTANTYEQMQTLITDLPNNWEFKQVQTFMERWFRREVHKKCEGRILKGLVGGQNLEVKFKSWEVVREAGCVVEEEDEDDGEDYEGEDGVEVINEKDSENGNGNGNTNEKGEVVQILSEKLGFEGLR